ncbi:DNA cytosine methyltransferase [Arthrobacter sp. NPDC090010]|uniref:DNA cytosine methyltransferase n=1 Tax=Arthrobacter sp. NPDC090010 TaxID=3363942 RepID=UPI00381CC20F
MTDMFCGAGGSSTGALAVPGIRVATAMNHWGRAIETHNTNHPDTDHVQADISQYDPRRIAPTDILWASPECTNHSMAKGRKRVTNQGMLFGGTEDIAADRSRATMWDVPRYAEQHRYPLIITENVVDAAKWLFFDEWLSCMVKLGYDHRIVFHNSMHAQLGGLPAPQSRDRMYVVFWRKGNRAPDFDRLRPKAYCPDHGLIDAMQAWKKPGQPWGRYRAQYVWRCPRTECRNAVVEPGWLPAASAIDWSLPGQRIGDREKPLAPKTMARIEAGLAKYSSEPFLSLMRSGRARNYLPSEVVQTLTTEGAGHCLIDPMVLEAAGNTYDSANPARGGGYYRIWPVSEEFRTLHSSVSKALLIPVEGRDGKDAQDAAAPMRTQTTRNETGILMTNNWANQARTTEDPHATLTTANVQSLLVPPAFLVRNNNVSGDSGYLTTPVDEPMRTLTTSGHQSLLVPYYSAGQARPTAEAMPTVTTVDRHALVTMRGANSPKHVRDVMDTVTAGGNHHGLMSVDVPAVEDCTFRMLEPHEVMWGMAFPRDYVMTGSKRDQVKQSGNAVTPPMARDLLMIGADSLQAP